MSRSPQEQTQQPLLFPADVEQPAQHADLGLPQRHYRPSVLRGLSFDSPEHLVLYIVSCTILALLFGFILYCFGLGWGRDGLQRLLVDFAAGLACLLACWSLFFLAALCGAVSMLLIKRSWGVYVYDRGFVYKKGGRCATACRWEQIIALWQKRETTVPVEGTHEVPVERKREIPVYILELQGGQGLALGPLDVVRRDELIALLGEQIRSRLLPSAIAAFEAGETLAFGDLRVNRDGVSNKDRTILWGEILDFSGLTTP